MQNIPLVVSPALLASAHDIGLNATHPMAVEAWKAHAMSLSPYEACGFILKGDRFVPVANTSPDPISHFTFDMADYTQYADEIEGIVHSHTPGPGLDSRGKPMLSKAEPSMTDMECQISTGVPWGISVVDQEHAANPVWWGDQLPIRPLIGRVFFHGINDCFSLVRDWHRLEGIYFDDVPRDSWWWQQKNEDGTDKDLYMELFASRGFKRVERQNPIAGDCFIACLHSGTRNHAGVFINDQEFIHHAGGSLSKRQFGHIWKQKLDFLVRHKDLPEEDNAQND